MQADHLQRPSHVAENVAMGQHHPLGSPGGAGSVNEGGERVFVQIKHLKRAAVFWQPATGSYGRGGRVSVQTDDGGKGGRRPGQGVEQAGIFQYQQARAGIVQTPGQVFRVVVRIQRHHHQAQTQRSLIDRYPVDAIFQA